MTGENVNDSALFRGGPSFHPGLERFLRSDDFPCARENLIERARTRNAGPAIMARLEKMPGSTYNTIEDFRQAFADDIENYGAVDETETPVR